MELTELRVLAETRLERLQAEQSAHVASEAKREKVEEVVTRLSLQVSLIQTQQKEILSRPLEELQTLFQSQVDGLEDRVEELRSDKRSQKMRIAELQERSAKLEADKNALQSSLDVSQSRLEELDSLADEGIHIGCERPTRSIQGQTRGQTSRTCQKRRRDKIIRARDSTPQTGANNPSIQPDRSTGSQEEPGRLGGWNGGGVGGETG